MKNERIKVINWKSFDWEKYEVESKEILSGLVRKWVENEDLSVTCNVKRSGS